MKTKRIIFLSILIFSIISVSAQNIFDKFSNNDNITKTKVPKELLSVVATNIPQISNSKINIKKLMSDIESLEIYSSKDKNGTDLMGKEISELKKDKNYVYIGENKISENQSILIYAYNEDNKIKEIILVTPNSASVIIRIIGNFTLSSFF